MVKSHRKMHKRKWTENPWTHLSYVPIPKFPHKYIKHTSLEVKGLLCIKRSHIMILWQVHSVQWKSRHFIEYISHGQIKDNMECFLSTLLNFNPFYFIFINVYVCICGNCICAYMKARGLYMKASTIVCRKTVHFHWDTVSHWPKAIESKLTGPQAKTISVFLPALGI